MPNKLTGAVNATDTKPIDTGAFSLTKSETKRRRHLNFDAAEREAQRLCGASGDTFIIMQEVARVKTRDGQEADRG